MATSAREEGVVGLRHIVLAVIAALKKLDQSRRAVALALFELALKDARKYGASGPFSQPFLVTSRALERQSHGIETVMPEAMEHLRLSMPAVASPDGMHCGAQGTGLLLFDIVRTIRNRSEDTQFVWWVRPGQWAHWHLAPLGRLFLCRVMTAWGAAESREVGEVICQVGLALASHTDEVNGSAPISVALGTLLEGQMAPGARDLPGQPGCVGQALGILKENKLIAGYEPCIETFVALGGDNDKPGSEFKSWRNATIHVDSPVTSLTG